MIPSILTQLLLIMVITITVVAGCRRLKFPPIIGYMIVGLFISLIGRHSFKHFSDLSVLARYGVIFLLFSIGLEFSFAHLIKMRKTVFGLGSLQMFFCGLIAFIACREMGALASTAFVIAVAIGMSSTAIVSKILTESGEVSTNVGRLTMGMLIFQDLMVVPAIIVTGFFAAHSGDNIITSLGIELIKGIFTFVVLVIIGKKIFTPIFDEVARARSAELFTLTALFVVLGAAYFSNLMGMSYEFGAFLAGAMLGGTPYLHQVEADIRPFRDVLLGLFFIGIGTMINVNVFVESTTLIVVVALAVFISKLLIISNLVHFMKLADAKEATKIGLLLSQAGEFGFVLVALASHYNFLRDTDAQILLAALILSMLLSIIALRFQNKLLGPLLFFLFRERKPTPDSLSDLKVKPGLILICGFSRVGQWVAKAITTEGHEYLALDLDPTIVNQARLAGENVVYANAADPQVLRNIHVDTARAVVLTFQDPLLSVKVLQQIRLHHKELPILVRTRDDNDIERLLAEGATEVIPDVLEASLMLSLHLFVNLGMDLTQAMQWSDNLRRDRYKLLKGYFVGETDSELTGNGKSRHQQRAIMIEETAFAANKTLHQLAVAQYGVEIIAMRKKGIVGPAPAPQAKLHPGDVLIVSGLLENIDRFEWHMSEGR